MIPKSKLELLSLSQIVFLFVLDIDLKDVIARSMTGKAHFSNHHVVVVTLASLERSKVMAKYELLFLCFRFITTNLKKVTIYFSFC